jgi:RNA polymerase sigma factor (sigma-70 family)
MKRSFLDSVLRGAEALAAREVVGTLPDPDLVRRFVAGRDSAAFAVLVRRHGPLVWGVCRNLLPADADAEDAFQATFLALVRSAGAIRQTEALGGWLHGVAYRVALKARRAAVRRKRREIRAAIPEPSSPVPDAAWDELQAAVHEEVCNLPDKLRLPFVLCGLQGKPQKEAAAILGWKVGTVSGRLSEARRRLLERLARRGVPASMAAGAAVLGGVAGLATVPSSLNAKVLTAVGSPTTASQTVLSLARGVTPMYLTRTKLLAVSLLLAGVLTTGVGVLSKADAQGQPKGQYDEALKHYYDALRVPRPPHERWEYKFIEIDKPLTTADLQKVLAGADQEGWSYCGSQELAQEKTGKITPHMVFKRPRAGAVGAADPNAAAAFLAEAQNHQRAAALAEREAAMKALKAEREAMLKAVQDQDAKARDMAEELRRQEAMMLQQKATAEKARDDAIRIKKIAEEKAAAERAEEAARGRRPVDEKAAREAEKALRLELEAMKAKYEEVIRQLQAELKAKSVQPPAKKPGPQASGGGDPFKAESDQPQVTTVVNLSNVDGKSAADALSKLMRNSKLVIHSRKDSLGLTGPVKVVEEAKEVIQKKIDVRKASGRSDPDSEARLVTIPLTHAKASAVLEAIEKVIGNDGGGRFHVDEATNTLLISATPAVYAKVQQLVEDLDRPSTRSK